jgi:hypothetical protein
LLLAVELGGQVEMAAQRPDAGYGFANLCNSQAAILDEPEALWRDASGLGQVLDAHASLVPQFSEGMRVGSGSS